MQDTPRRDAWPELPLSAWRDTYATLHMYMQIIGKVRLELSPITNQWWNVPYDLTARGMTTSPIPFGSRTFEVDFDFVDHNLLFLTSEGATRALRLVPRTVADFEREVFAILRALEVDVHINPRPTEVPDPIPFPEDTKHGAYDPEYAHRFWEITRRIDAVLKSFRARFRGKCSPVQFFWGTFDLAVTRFSGRQIAVPPSADRITRYAYDEEVSSVGFWPGDESIGDAALYAYTAPEPEGLPEQRILPHAAFYSREKKEFLLMYDDVRRAPSPEKTILEFAQSTYDAGASLANWDRSRLAYPPGERRTAA